MNPIARVAAIIVGIAAVAAVAVLGFLTGDIVRWSDGYQALEAGEIAYPARGKDGERVRLANAMAESEPPQGMPTERRLHPVGTLAHLRYETLRADGSVSATTEVRALVPQLPTFIGMSCPRGNCLARGGSPGLAPEWVLRMPVGKPLDWGMQSFTFQDIEDKRPISLPHARYRVTLLDACAARVRVGSITRLEFNEYATVPIPKGLVTRRWVQLDDCDALVKKRPARPAPPPPPAAVSTATPPYAYKPPKLELLRPERGAVGRMSLVVEEGVMLERNQTMHVFFQRICRYDPPSNRWVALAIPDGGLEVAGPPRMNHSRVAYRFPEDPGLYWAQWSEAPANDKGAARIFALVIPGGTSVHCRESDLPAPAAGEIALCVPRNGPALPGTVPDPASSCP